MRIFLLFLFAQTGLLAQSSSNLSLTPVEIGLDHISFSWNTDSKCDCELLAGKEIQDLRTVATIPDTRNFQATVSGLQPSELVYASVRCQAGNTRMASDPQLFITASGSTGKIKVYFNHQVNTAVSTGQNAQSLYGLVDDTLIAHINRATQSIDIAIYNASASSSLSDIAAALNAAYSRGVKIRLIYESDNTNSLIPNISSNIKKLASPSGFNYGIMHNKFVIFDAKSSDVNKPMVWTGSTNWTVAQLNGPDLNNVITIQDKSLALAYRMEFEEMWGDTGLTPNSSASKFGPYKSNNTPHNFNIAGVPVECYFSPSDGVNSRIIEKIQTATYDIEVGSMIITRTDIASSLTAQFSSGVGATHVLVDDSSGTTTWPTLRGGMGSARVRSHNGISGIMHHKFMIVDAQGPLSDPLVLTGSHNWSTSAETKNDENTLVIHDATIANLYYQAFSRMFNDAGGVLSVKEDSGNSIATLFPVPASDILNIDFVNTGDHLIEIYTVTGSRIFSKRESGSIAKLDLSDLPSAAYLVNVKSEGSSRYYRILISR